MVCGKKTMESMTVGSRRHTVLNDLHHINEEANKNSTFVLKITEAAIYSVSLLS